MFKIVAYGNLIVLLCNFDPSWADCTRPPNIDHSRQISFYLSTSYPNGFRVKYVCETGYVMLFRDTIHCDNGLWMSQSMLNGYDLLMLPQCKWMDHDGVNVKGGGDGSFGMNANTIFVVVIVVTVILTVIVCCIRLANITAIPLRRRTRSGVRFFVDPEAVTYKDVRNYESSAPRPPPPAGTSTSHVRRTSEAVSLEDSFECYSMTPSSSNNKLEGLHVAEVA